MHSLYTNDGRSFFIRQATEGDAQCIINYSMVLFSSTDQVLTTLQEYTMTIENEKLWINDLNQNPYALLRIAELDNCIIGLLFFNSGTKSKNSHTGEFGVSVHPEFQGIGIGRLLIGELLSWAKANAQIEKVFLNVFATNGRAIKLYTDIGFIEEGRHVKAIKQPTGEYVDVVQMYIETK